MKRKFIISICMSTMLALVSTPAIAQNKVVQGTVYDELGEPVIGASVQVKGTKYGTVTDLDGNL